MTKIGTITYIKSGDTIETKYPTLATGSAEQFILQTDEDMLTMMVTINFVAERLYYKIMKADQTFLCLNIPLIEDVNLCNGYLSGYNLFLQGHDIYFGKA